jgi:hypothetical protein
MMMNPILTLLVSRQRRTAPTLSMIHMPAIPEQFPRA